MQPSHATELSPLAFQLAAKLENYELKFEELADGSFDPERCRVATRELERVGCFAGGLPQLAVDIQDLTSRHFGLMQALSKAADRAGRSSGDTATLLRRQHLAVQAAREKCVKLIARN